MRQPLPALGLVDAQRFQPRVQIARQQPRAAALVVEREHADAARLSVTPNRQDRPFGTRGRLAQRVEDRLDLAHGPVAEKRERDVQVLGREHTDVARAAKSMALPLDEPVDRLRRKPERAKEAYPFTAFEASRDFRACLCQLCARSVRTAWSAAAVARPRIAERSPGRLSSREALPSVPSACR